MVLHSVGTPRKGKTTFAWRAYENSDIYSKVVESDVVNAVEECCLSGRNFRIACDAIPVRILTVMDHETSFGKILLYEALKYHWK